MTQIGVGQLVDRPAAGEAMGTATAYDLELHWALLGVDYPTPPSAPGGCSGCPAETDLRGPVNPYHVEPRTRRRCEMQVEARVLLQPRLHVRVLVGGVVVQDHVHRQALGHLAVDPPEGLQELLVAVSRQAVADDDAGEHVQRGEQG